MEDCHPSFLIHIDDQDILNRIETRRSSLAEKQRPTCDTSDSRNARPLLLPVMEKTAAGVRVAWMFYSETQLCIIGFKITTSGLD